MTLIRPPGVSSRYAYSMMAAPPLGLAYVAGSLLAAGHEVFAVDALGEAPHTRVPSVHPRLSGWGLAPGEILARIPPHTRAIGISVMFSQQWPDVEALLRALAARFPGAALFVGGEHASATWQYLLERCPELTACVLGEGEESAVALVAALERGQPLEMVAGLAVRSGGRALRTAPRPRLRAVDEIPRPAWHLFPLERYLSQGLGHGVNRGRSIPMLATRGCPYRCTFCSSPQMWGTRYYLRSVSSVVDEIEDYVRTWLITNVDFEDLTAIIRRDWILDFCRELQRRHIHITWQLPSGTRSEALDAEVLEQLWRTGCRNITYAPESGSLETLGAIKKKLRPARVLESMRQAKRLGINVKANLMIGFPDETRAQLFETLAFAARAAWLGVDDLPLFPFSPYPGTELYDRLAGEGRLPPLDNDFFASLGYMDVSDTRSYSRHVGTAELNLYRVAGMALSYAIGYLRHPRRIGRSLGNLVRGRSDTVLEQALLGLARRRAADGRLAAG